MNLTEGILRVRYRDSWELPVSDGAGRGLRDYDRAVPDEQSVRVRHRLRLDIASSNFPHFDVNPNSGEPEGAMEHPRIARQPGFCRSPRALPYRACRSFLKTLSLRHAVR